MDRNGPEWTLSEHESADLSVLGRISIQDIQRLVTGG